MAKRMKRVESWAFFEHPLTANDEAEQGNVACINTTTGLLAVADEDSDLFPIGYFVRDLTGDGTAKARVQLFEGIWVHAFANDANDPVTADDVGSLCFLVDGGTVSAEGTGRAVAGRVWSASANRVHVQMALSMGPEGPQGAPGD